jgi:hypothetical protein
MKCSWLLASDFSSIYEASQGLEREGLVDQLDHIFVEEYGLDNFGNSDRQTLLHIFAQDPNFHSGIF